MSGFFFSGDLMRSVSRLSYFADFFEECFDCSRSLGQDSQFAHLDFGSTGMMTIKISANALEIMHQKVEWREWGDSSDVFPCWKYHEKGPLPDKAQPGPVCAPVLKLMSTNQIIPQIGLLQLAPADLLSVSLAVSRDIKNGLTIFWALNNSWMPQKPFLQCDCLVNT